MGLRRWSVVHRRTASSGSHPEEETPVLEAIFQRGHRDPSKTTNTGLSQIDVVVFDDSGGNRNGGSQRSQARSVRGQGYTGSGALKPDSERSEYHGDSDGTPIRNMAWEHTTRTSNDESGGTGGTTTIRRRSPAGCSGQPTLVLSLIHI